MAAGLRLAFAIVAIRLPFGTRLAGDFEESIFIVLTQDCDLVQPDFSKEPYAELLLAAPIADNPDGNLLYGKNPRMIQFPVGEKIYQACCHDRCRLERQVLATCSPSTTHFLENSNMGLLREWMAKRYVRPAFPDSLNRRLRSGSPGKAIRKLLETKGQLFQELYLMCLPIDRELPDDQPYRISLWLAVTTDNSRNPPFLVQAHAACREIATALKSCSGIDLLECKVRSEREITLDDLLFFKSWDFDYLTYREALQPS